jgi:hypothetical protein
MSGTRSVMGTVNRYVSLAGKSCCCGRSWVGLNASLARHGEDAGDCDQAPAESTGEETKSDETTFVSAGQH